MVVFTLFIIILRYLPPFFLIFGNWGLKISILISSDVCFPFWVLFFRCCFLAYLAIPSHFFRDGVEASLELLVSWI